MCKNDVKPVAMRVKFDSPQTCQARFDLERMHSTRPQKRDQNWHQKCLKNRGPEPCCMCACACGGVCAFCSHVCARVVPDFSGHTTPPKTVMATPCCMCASACGGACAFCSHVCARVVPDLSGHTAPPKTVMATPCRPSFFSRKRVQEAAPVLGPLCALNSGLGV